MDCGMEILNPYTKKDDLLAFLTEFHFPVSVHIGNEPEYEHLGPESIEIEVVNPKNGENLYLLLEDEFTLSFANWHTHYFAGESEYSSLKADVKEILENKKGSLSVFSASRWLGSSLTDTRFDYRLDERGLMKQAVSQQEFLDEIGRIGGKVVVTYWEPVFSYSFDIPRQNEEPDYRYPCCGGIRYLVRNGKALLTAELREYELGLACMQFLYQDESVVTPQTWEFYARMLLERLEADVVAEGFSSIFALCMQEDAWFYLQHGYQLIWDKDWKKLEKILSVKQIHDRMVQKYLGSEKKLESKKLVAIRKADPWERSSRESIWNIQMNLPVEEDQFHIVEEIIRSLRYVRNNFLIVDFAQEINHASYIQISHDGDNYYYVEIHFEKPCAFSYEWQGKKKIRIHPFTQYSIRAKGVEEAIQIFRDVLCKRQLPDISSWTSCAKDIFLENLSRDTYQKKP